MKKTIILIALISFSTFACQNGLAEQDKKAYAQKGKEIAQSTAKLMGGEVVKRMKEGGVAKAAPFCNANASILTDEMSEKSNVSIKRVSDKYRNEKNAPNKREAEILAQLRELIASGEKLYPIVEEDEAGKPHFYAPINVQQKCLSCHGIIGESMKHEADSILKILYPNDRATGFKEGDLRGIWSIAFNE